MSESSIGSALESPPGILDLTLLLSRVDFPVYALAQPTPRFRLLAVNFSTMDGLIHLVSLVYVFPAFVGYSETAIVCQARRKDLPEISDSPLEYLLLAPMIESLLKSYLPVGMTSLGLPVHNVPVLDSDNLRSLPWEKSNHPHLELEVCEFLEEQRWPLHLAKGVQSDILFSAGSGGVSKERFSQLVESLVPLKSSKRLIEQHQRDLESAANDMRAAHG